MRESWWPSRRGEAYGSEPFSAVLTDGHRDGSLDAAGMVRFDDIPAGSCEFLFNKFYDEIDKYFNDQLG